MRTYQQKTIEHRRDAPREIEKMPGRKRPRW
jgi:hypothetical protein